MNPKFYCRFLEKSVGFTEEKGLNLSVIPKARWISLKFRSEADDFFEAIGDHEIVASAILDLTFQNGSLSPTIFSKQIWEVKK